MNISATSRPIAELAALTNLKNLLLENYSKYFDDLLSGERSLPFALLVRYLFKFIEYRLPNQEVTNNLQRKNFEKKIMQTFQKRHRFD